jgi:hypothetical protein
MKVFVESHSGWTAKQTMTGGYDILDQNGWALATLHYDYKFTCNATNHFRANLLSAAPDLLKAIEGLIVAVEAEVNEKGGGGLILARLTDARAAVLKAHSRPATPSNIGGRIP